MLTREELLELWDRAEAGSWVDPLRDKLFHAVAADYMERLLDARSKFQEISDGPDQ